MNNPYVRRRELEKELEVLEVDERHFKNYPTKSRQYKRIKEEEEVKSKIFFIAMEKLIIEDCIEYFEKELNSKEEVKTCATKHLIPPKSKDSGILPNFI